MNTKIRTLILLTLFGTLPLGRAVAAPVMTLDDYLKKVEAANPEIKAIDLSLEATTKKVQEMDLVYSPLLMAGYTYANDRSGPGFGSTLPTSGMTASSWDVSASKKFRLGTNVTAGYRGSSASFDLLSPTAVIGADPVNSFTGHQMQPYVRAEQSLLRDFKSGLTQSGIQKTKAAAQSGQYMQLFRRQQILTRARSAYWALSLAREVLAFRNASLARTEKLLRWNEKRVKLDLADQSDLLQAQGAYQMRQLNVQLAEEELVKAGREFNELLDVSSDQVAEDLDTLADKITYDAGVPALERRGERADVLAARAAFESSRLADRETHYRSMPELSLVGTYSLNGIGLNQGTAWSEVAGFSKPAFTLGLSFIVPLDYKTLTTVRSGYQKDFESAKATLAKTELSARNDWAQLNRTWTSVKARLAIAREMRDVQEKRVAVEQGKFDRGRTTTFLLLTAENDLDDATLNLYRLVFEEFVTAAQAELYNTRSLPALY